MISDWQTNTVLFADTLTQRYPQLTEELRQILEDHKVPCHFVVGTADVWIRDYAPVQVGRKEWVQFIYRPDYLQGGYEHLITGPEVFRGRKYIAPIDSSDLVIDGGNIVTDGKRAILTDKIYKENSDREREEIREILRCCLGTEELIIVPREPYDRIGHADGMVRFIAEGTVVVNDFRQADPNFHDRLTKVLAAANLLIELLPYAPSVQQKQEIASAVGNYVNFLRVGDLVVMPTYGIPEDQEAQQRLQKSLPQAEIVPLDSRELAKDGGVLNCISSTVRMEI